MLQGRKGAPKGMGLFVFPAIVALQLGSLAGWGQRAPQAKPRGGRGGPVCFFQEGPERSLRREGQGLTLGPAPHLPFLRWGLRAGLPSGCKDPNFPPPYSQQQLEQPAGGGGRSEVTAGACLSEGASCHPTLPSQAHLVPGPPGDCRDGSLPTMQHVSHTGRRNCSLRNPGQPCCQMCLHFYRHSWFNLCAGGDCGR